MTIGRYVPYQRSGEPFILPLHLPVPLHTWKSCPFLLPNPDKPHDASNLFPKDLPDRAPINNNRRIPSNYPRACSLIVEVAMVATNGINTYNTQLWLLGTASHLYITPGYGLGMTIMNKKWTFLVIIGYHLRESATIKNYYMGLKGIFNQYS